MYNKLQVYTKRESKIYPYDEKIRHHLQQRKDKLLNQLQNKTCFLIMSKLPMAHIIKSNDYRILSTQNQDLYLFIIHYPIDYLATLK